MKTKIVADSSCDLNPELRKNLNITLAPLTIKIGDTEYIDNEELDVKKLIDHMHNTSTRPQTASPSPSSFMKEYQEAENVFVVTLSSALSSTYNHAVMAKDMILEQTSDKFIHVFDSFSASIAETLISLKISELIHKNHTNHEIVDKVNEYIDEMKTFFVLDSLDNLIKAGRINVLVAKIATAFSIKPIMYPTETGSINLLEKARGSKKALRRLVELIGEKGEKFEDKILGIAHCDCLERAEAIRDEIKKRYNFKDVIIVETAGLSSVYANSGGIIISF